MMQKYRRILSLLLIFLTIFSIMPFNAFAVNDTELVFKPAINVMPTPAKSPLTQQELENIYNTTKGKIDNDIASQRAKVQENYNLEEAKKAASKTVSSSSTLSAVESTTLQANNMTEAVTALTLDAPTNLDIDIPGNGNTIKLTWTGVAGVEGYAVYKDGVKLSEIVGEAHEAITTLDTNGQEYAYFIRAYAKDENGTKIESANSNTVIAVKGNTVLSTTKTLAYDYVYGGLTLSQGANINLAGHKLKVYSQLLQNGNSQLHINNGNLNVMGSYIISQQSVLRMNDSQDYVYVDGEFNFGTSIPHNVTDLVDLSNAVNYLSDGEICVTGDFKLTGTVKNFLPDGNHKVYITSSNFTTPHTIDFNGDMSTCKFNYLILGKPISKYIFNPQERRPIDLFARHPIMYIDSADSYFGTQGVYSPSGNFSRSYTDMAIKTRGENDIKIGRAYSSQNTKSGMLGKGWTFSYEASLEVDAANNTAIVNMPEGNVLDFKYVATPTPTSPTPTPVPSSATKIYQGTDVRATLSYYQTPDTYILTFKDKTKYGFGKKNNKYVLLYIEDKNANKISISYDASYRISGITDNVSTVDITYSGNTIEIKDNYNGSMLRKVTYILNASGRIYTATDAIGNIIYRYTYTDTNNIPTTFKVEEATASGQYTVVDNVAYKSNGKIDTWTDINGMTSSYIYNANETRTVYTVDGVTRTKIDYYDISYASLSTNVDGYKTTTVYFTDNVGDLSVNKYNEIQYKTDVNFNCTQYERDSNGNITKVINPDTSVKEMGYYPDDLLKWVLDEDKNYTFYDYDSKGNVTFKYVYKTDGSSKPQSGFTQTNSYVTQYTYKLDGQISTVIDPNNHTTIYNYDNDGKLISVIDSENKKIEYSYETATAPTPTPMASPTRSTSRSLVSEKVQLNGESTYLSTWYEYDKNDRLLRKTLCNSDFKGTATKKSIERYVYDNIGRLVQKITPKIYNPSNDTLDASGNIIGAYQDLTVGYRYTYKLATENVTRLIDPEEFIYDSDYNEAGLLSLKVNPDPNLNGGSNKTSYSYVYDSLNRLVSVWAAAIGVTTRKMEYYNYSGFQCISPGNYLRFVEHYTVVDDSKSIKEVSKYDYAGRIVESSKSYVGDPYEIKNTVVYNASGSIKSATDGENNTTYYFYNTNNKPIHIWTPFEKDSGVVTSYTYKRIVYDDGGNVINEAVKIDPVSAADYASQRITIQNCSLSSGFYVATNTYYNNNKLKLSTSMTGERKQYFYDGANIVNRIEEYKDETTTNYRATDYLNNYLGKIGKETIYIRKCDLYGETNSTTLLAIEKNYTYDLNGNLTIAYVPSMQTTDTYVYDELNRLKGGSKACTGYAENTETWSKFLNWNGDALTEMDPRGYMTFYTYDWRGFNKKATKNITMYDEPTDSYISKSVITLSWYDNIGRKVADVSPNNYNETYENLDVSAINNYSYYEYNVSGKITKKGFKGYEKKFTELFNWTDTALVTAKSYTYDYNGNVTAESDVDGANTYTTEYKYSPQGKLISKLDPENKLRSISATVSYDYDTLGRIKKESYVDSATTSIGLITTYDYTSEKVSDVIKTNTVTKKVNLGDNGTDVVVEINKMDLLGNIIEKSQCKGGVQYTWYYEYNNFGKLSKINEPYKATSTGTLQYARKDMKYSYQGELVFRVSYSTPISQPASNPVVTPNDVVDLYTVNPINRKIEVSCQQKYYGTEVIITRATYDKNGNQLTATDGNNVVTTYAYDEGNRMTSESVTVGSVAHLTKYDYDFNGNVIFVNDWRGNYTKSYYDAMNRIYQKEDQKYIAYEKLEYNALGLQVKSYDARNSCTQFDYDKNRRLIKITDPRNHYTQTQYDNLGNIKKKIDGRLNELVYNYDKLGRVTDIYDSTVLKASYTYYIDGAMKEQKIGGTYTTLYTYYPNGKVDKISDPAEPTPTPSGSYTPTPVPTPLSENYEYNPDGTLSKKIDRKGIASNYAYDAHGRLTSQTTVNGTDSTTITIPNTSTDKGYDDNGNLKKIILEKKVSGTVQSTITTERTYDELNRVITKKETTVEGGTTTVIGPVIYTYDITTGVGAGEIKEQAVYPGTGNTVEKIYDVTGKLRCVKSDGQQTDYTYYNDGRRNTITYNGAFKQTFTYYTDGLLDTLTNSIKNSSGVFEESEYYDYEYDAAHNMSSKTERIKNPITNTSITTSTSYIYDRMNRLWIVTEGTKETTYLYDSRGNRETVNVNDNGTVTYTKYDYRANNTLKLETVRNGGPGGTIKQKKEYTYDNNGNLTKIDDITGTLKNITTNTYTLLNQLESSTTGATTLNNRYNAEGYRVSKFVTGNTPTRYFYEGDKVVFEYNNSGAVGAFNVIGLNLISRKIGTDKVYYFYNGHGDVTSLLHAANNKIRAQYSYDSFGNIRTEKYFDSTGAATTDPTKMIKSQVRYSEYQYDPETEYKDSSNNTVTGLYYLNARHYDPGTARFLETDTYTGDINDPLSLNLYTYCHNEPMMYTDPTGHIDQNKRLQWIKGVTDDYLKSDEVAELQKALLFLGIGEYFKENIPASQIGNFGEKTYDAVNIFKDKFLKGGNQGDNRGVVGATTWVYIDREVALKKLSMSGSKGTAYNQQYLGIMELFNTRLGNLMKPTTSVASTTGNAYNNGKSNVTTTGANISPDFIGPIRQQDVRTTDSSIVPSNISEKNKIYNAIHNGELLSNFNLHLISTLVRAITGNKDFSIDTADIGGKFLMFDEEGNTGIFHANLDCWQQYFGYNNIYDWAFDIGTSMDKEKFPFKYKIGDKEEEIILWAWKGDYVNMGAGAELGIYKKKTVFGVDTHQWDVDKDLSLPMTLNLKYNNTPIIDYKPKENQWWITGFNSNYKGKMFWELTASFTVTFPEIPGKNQGMYKAFYNTYGQGIDKDKRWKFYPETNTAKFDF